MVAAPVAPLHAVRPAPVHAARLSRRVVFRCAPRPRLATPPPLPAGTTAPERHAPCAPGAVPQPLGVSAPKGFPRSSGLAPAPARAADSAYMYAAFWTPAVGDAGASGYIQQAAPHLDQPDFHTLAEIAAASDDGQQVVEVGWTVDRRINADDAPRIFAFHWVDGAPTCYDGCGFVQVSTTVHPGDPVDPKLPPQLYAIRYRDGNWWLAADGEWMGFFPGSIWAQSFTEIGTVQWFGEVSVASEPSCTDMGDGAFADSPGAATISSMQLVDQNGVARAAEPYAFATATDRYTVDDARGGFGGPGACADTAITSEPLDVTRQRSPTFTFASEDPAARFECAFDPPASPFAPCSGPDGSARPTAPLSDGDHTFEVRAIDARGAVDPTPATAELTVDTKPPRVRVEARRVQRLARGARLIVACDEPCSLSAAPTLGVRRGSRLTRIHLRTLRRELDGAGGETLVVRPAGALRSRLRSRLAHGAHLVLTVKLVAADDLGHISRRSIQVSLRP